MEGPSVEDSIEDVTPAVNLLSIEKQSKALPMSPATTQNSTTEDNLLSRGGRGYSVFEGDYFAPHPHHSSNYKRLMSSTTNESILEHPSPKQSNWRD